MRGELPKKMLFIQAQEWYKPNVCSNCPEFNLMSLPKGIAAFCNMVESDQPCPMESAQDELKKERELVATLLELESIPQMEIIPD
jgi:hypothetical protein